MHIIRILMSLWFLGVGAENPRFERYPEAVEVFHCNFDASCDADHDLWPDGWTRQRGQNYPNYVKIQLQPPSTPTGKPCLQVNLDGGGAAVFGPPVQIETLYSYLLEAYVRTDGLKYDKAYLSLAFLDAQKYPLATYKSEDLTDTNGWKQLRLGPIAPPSSETHWVVIGLHLEPRNGEDLKGTVQFADIWLGRLPRMALKTNQAYNLFLSPAKIEVTCTASGIADKNTDVTFKLIDLFDRCLASETRNLAAKSDALKAETQKDIANPGSAKIFTAAWEAPTPRPGFYKVQVEMNAEGTVIQRRELTLALIEPRNSPAGGEFGWSLPQGDNPIPLSQLDFLLSQAGINWVKYPLWCGQSNIDATLSQLLAFGERLDSLGIELVGLLNEPPEPLREQFESGPVVAAKIFNLETKDWYPSLEPTLDRLGPMVRWWQLGGDTDASLETCPNLADKLRNIKNEMDRTAQDINLGIGWDWMNALPSKSGHKELPLRFVSLAAKTPLNESELAARLDSTKNSLQKRWVVLEPLSKSDYPLMVRVQDLVRRMITAKIHGADAVFCPNPFDADHGLMNKDGTPGELFLPWRTTALELTGAELLGSVELPRESNNLIFTKDDQTVMVVWNEKPVEEVLFPGKAVKQIDLWGRTYNPEKRDETPVVQVDNLPTFVTGLSKHLARWALDLTLAQDRMASVFGQVQATGFGIKNPFPHGVSGTVKIIAPEGWLLEPKQVALRLAAGEQLQQPISITFPYTVESGRHEVRFDFEIQADRLYKFSVIRHVEVDLGNMHIRLKTRLNANNELEVEQRFVNKSGQPVKFNCELFAPQRRRLKSQILDLGDGEDVQTYRLEDGKELIGLTLWLRASETNGPRILNYRFAAEP